MPLNRLRPKPMQYPNANDAIPLVKKIKGDDKFRLAFEQVWGKAVVCPNLEVAAGYSRGGEITAVTLDGLYFSSPLSQPCSHLLLHTR